MGILENSGRLARNWCPRSPQAASAMRSPTATEAASDSLRGLPRLFVEGKPAGRPPYFWGPNPFLLKFPLVEWFRDMGDSLNVGGLSLNVSLSHRVLEPNPLDLLASWTFPTAFGRTSFNQFVPHTVDGCESWVEVQLRGFLGGAGFRPQ